MDLLQQGIEKGHIKFDTKNIEDARQITYIHQNKKRNFKKPEERVQAETFLKLILYYNYPVDRIRIFQAVKTFSSTGEADIIVYHDDACTKPYIIVECKKENVTEAEFEQAIEQAGSYAYALSGTTKYIWVTTGVNHKYFKVDKESQTKPTESNIPRFGVYSVQKYKYVKGGRKIDEDPGSDIIKLDFSELEIISEDKLKQAFKKAHNALWEGGKLNPSEAFDEFNKLIFCKIWDEKEDRRKGDPYDFQIISKPKPKNASKEEIEKIEKQVTKELFDRVNKLYAKGKKEDPEVFKDDIRLAPEKVRTIVENLQSINLMETDLDSKGKAFEEFLSSYFRGNFGQFFTPRPIVKFIVNSLPIINKSRVLDTSCGSGGFLLFALDKVRKQADAKVEEGYFKKDSIKYWTHWHDFAKDYLFGIEINEQIARTAKMNMIIHDDGHTNVVSSDGLLKSEVIIERTGNKEFKNNSFDFIITNPPFGSAVKLNEKSYLQTYKFGNKDVSWLDTKNSAVKKRSSQSTEVLFIEQCRNFLKPGGFLAIVLPDGVLTNSSLQDIRDRIEKWYRIVSVISLPQTAFAHTGAGVKSSVMFLRKQSEKKTDSIETKIINLQEKIKEENNYEKKISEIEKEKKQTIKQYNGFENTTGETDKKAIEKTDIFKTWKKGITDKYNQQISNLKEEMEEIFVERKQKELSDYPIFMAIAEDIGYDATGKPTGNNELEVIETELKRFIAHIIKEETL